MTRGNGLVGNDVTGNVKTIGAVPLRLCPAASPSRCAARSSCPRASSSTINAKMEEPYANPRNLASGTLRRVKSSEVAGIPLSIYVYEGFFEKPPDTHHEILEQLEELGFRLNPRVGLLLRRPAISMRCAARHPAVARGPPGGHRPASSRQERAGPRRWTTRSTASWSRWTRSPSARGLGYTGHHPRWAIAFKFESPQGATTVKAIEVAGGQDGRITPVARVEPVKISGATISNVTLHNQEYIDMLELAIGDRVAVSRRGDVIPAVERVLEKNETGAATWKLPGPVPTCGDGPREAGRAPLLPQRRCPDQVRGRLTFFVGRGQMDIEGLGPETIDVLISNGLVKDIDDLYFFDPDKLLDLPGFGEKKVAQIREGIEKSKRQPFHVVFPSLGIPDIGQKVTELLIEAGYADIDSLLALADSGRPRPAPGDPRHRRAHGGDADRGARQTPTCESGSTGLRKAGLQFEEEDHADARRTFRRRSPARPGASRAASSASRRGRRRWRRCAAAEAGSARCVTSKTTHLLVGENPGSKLREGAEARSADRVGKGVPSRLLEKALTSPSARP